MNCEQARSGLLPANFDGLEDEESQALETHLSTCPACKTLDSEVSSALSLLERPAMKAPEAAWDKIKNRIHEDIARKPSAPALKIAVSCTYCKGQLERAESVFCGSCLAPHHPGCFEEYGRCSNLGCAETRTVKPLETAGQRFPMPAIQAKATERKPRRRAKLVAALVLGAGTAFGMAAMVGDPQKQNSVDIAQVAPLARPLLKKARTQYRQVLDGRVSEVTVDRDGDPWFGLSAQGARGLKSFKASFKDAMARKRDGQDDLVIENGLLAIHGDDGLLVAQTQQDEESSYAVIDGQVKTVPLPPSTKKASTLDPKILDLPDGETFLDQDKYGRVYARALNKQIVVYDPWAAGRYPKALVEATAGLSFRNSGQALLFWGNQASTLKSRLDPKPLAKMTEVFPLKDGGLFFLYKDSGKHYNGRFGADGTYSAGAEAILAGKSGYSSALELLSSHRSILLKELDCTKRSFGKIKLAVDEEKLWVLDGGKLTCLTPTEALPVRAEKRALKNNVLFPSPYDGVFIIRDDQSLYHFTVEAGAVTESKVDVTIPENSAVFSGAKEQLWHSILTDKDLNKCNWQGQNRGLLGVEAFPKISIGDTLLAVKENALVTWDGAWETQLLPGVAKTSHILHDKKSNRLVILSLSDDPGSIRMTLFNLTVGTGVKKLAGAVDWSVLIPFPSGANALSTSFVAEGKLWIEENGKTLKAISLPPRTN
ncbi:MAG: hypothetical protein P1V97_22895 [Planctomycetota bacterium]|nr:hypothetical protein [Planctomycetota bacterium]